MRRRPSLRLARASAVTFALILIATACTSSSHRSAGTQRTVPSRATTTDTSASSTTTVPIVDASPLPGMPPLLDPHDVYAADRPNRLSPTVAGFRSLVYVPNSTSDSVDEIDPATGAIVRHFATGRLPQHVVPSWDLKTLYVTNDLGNSLTPIDPATGVPGRQIPVDDPYNMYFTPDGRFAVVVAERLQRLDFRDPHTFALEHSLHVDCRGVDHVDFSANGRYLVASCEFSGRLIEVDVARQAVVGTVVLNHGFAKPQDVKLDPSGRVFYVADMNRGGIYTVTAAPSPFRVTGFISTGAGAHGLYVSRDSTTLYVTNRGAGSVSLFDFASGRVTRTWSIPGGGSPDMGGVSADGTVLWISGRYNAEVYAFDTRTGALLRRIHVGSGPHGLCVYPQPGRYSLGHTGIFR